jgi:transcriptional regulator with XRE-family HTH domain
LKKEFEHLGQFLKAARAKSGLSQQAIGDKIGAHPQFVSNWERGLCAPPNHGLEKVIQMLKLKKHELVEVMMMDENASIERKIYSNRKRLPT